MPQSAEETYATRATLLARLKDWGDQASWQDFFDTYWKLIFSVARKRGLSEVEAQDVVQETMLSVAKQMPQFTYSKEKGSFKAWLLNLTRWRITDQLRKRGPFDSSRVSDDAQADNRVLDQIMDETGAGRDLERVWDDEWRANILHIATQRVKVRLVPEKYQIFDFCVNKGWATDKIAAAFRIPIGQVYLAKHRVTRMIRNEVARLELDLDRTGAPGPLQAVGESEVESGESMTE